MCYVIRMVGVGGFERRNQGTIQKHHTWLKYFYEKQVFC